VAKRFHFDHSQNESLWDGWAGQRPIMIRDVRFSPESGRKGDIS
jgi:hypothetical protein